MNKIVIIETDKHLAKNPLSAHARNAIILSRELPAPLLAKRDSFKNNWNLLPKHIIISYATYYLDFKVVKAFLDKNPKAKLWFMVNEYNLNPNADLFADREWRAIINFPQKVASFKKHKTLQGIYTFNLNLLFYKKPNEITGKKYDLIYFGTWRPDRKDYFLKYLNKNCYISTSKKNAKRFLHAGCEGKLIGKLNWQNGKETLNNFKYSIYIEDEFTHKNFNYLANRFYEALFCNVITFFDVSCLNTLEQSGIDGFEQYIVENALDLKKKIKSFNKDFERHLKEQQKWNAIFKEKRAELLNDLRELLK